MKWGRSVKCYKNTAGEERDVHSDTITRSCCEGHHALCRRRASASVLLAMRELLQRELLWRLGDLQCCAQNWREHGVGFGE
jgi:hypothetical protein